MSRGARLAIAAAVAAVCAVVAWRAFRGEEGAVRNAVLAGVRAVESGDLDALASILAGDFAAPPLRGKDEALRAARRFFEMSRGREVKIKKLDIAIEGDRARASCQFELRATIEMEGVSAPINLYRAIEDGGESMTPFELAKKSRQMPADLAEFEWRRSGDGWLLEQMRYPEMGKWLNRYWDGGLE